MNVSVWLAPGQTIKVEVSCPQHGKVSIEVQGRGKVVTIGKAACPFNHDSMIVPGEDQG